MVVCPKVFFVQCCAPGVGLCLGASLAPVQTERVCVGLVGSV